MCISPEQLGPSLIHCQSIRPAQVVADQHCTSRAIHPRAFQLGILTPVRPVHIPGEKPASITETEVTSPVLTPRQPLDNTNPISWYKAIARGLSRFCQTKTFLMEPSRFPTSIRFVPVSVQYIFLPIASTASPSVVNRPEKRGRCIGHCSSSQLSQEFLVFPLCTSSGSCFRLCLLFHQKFKDYSTRASENLSFHAFHAAWRQEAPRPKSLLPVVMISSNCEPSRAARLILRSVLSDQ